MSTDLPSLDVPEQFRADCQTIGLELDDEVLAQQGRYLHLLLEANRQFNLTAIRDEPTAWRRHVLESLALLPLVEKAKSLIDVGSGGGAPGLPLAIAMPALPITLLEATGKKARFLESTAAALRLEHVTVIHDRAETIGQSGPHRQQYDVVAARAVGPINVLLELALPLATVGGRLLAIKGKQAEQELDEAGDALMQLGGGAVSLHEALPGLDDDAVILEVVKDRPTPPQFPRRPGLPKQQPL